MKRSALIIGLLALLSLTGVVYGQDKVIVVDRKTGKEKEVSGQIQDETPAGITLKQGTATTLIPALDVNHVAYRLGEVKNFEYIVPFNREKSGLDTVRHPDAADRKTLLREAHNEYEKLAPKMRDNPFAYRYLQYKIAVVQVYAAREDEAKRDAAIAALNNFRKEFVTGWEIVPCLKLLAQMQEEKGDVDGARETFKELRTLPGVTKDLVRESNLLIANMLMRGKRYAEAETTLREARATMPDDDPQKAALTVYLCQAQMMQGKTQEIEKQLQSAIAGTSEPSLRALAHNTLGDYYREKNQNEDAFWQYLRVDVLYASDREEHARSLFWLSKLYESVKRDKAKAQECVERLKSKDFEGAEFARRLAAEK